jgi:hypothetical protein
MFVMKLIDTPSWAPQCERDIDTNMTEQERLSYESTHDEVMLAVADAVQRYIDNTRLSFQTAEAGFPSLERLTGEYYVARVSCRVVYESWLQRMGKHRQVRLSVLCHCLEPNLFSEQVGQDYLGLEVHFTHDETASKFLHLGDVDSSSI